MRAFKASQKFASQFWHSIFARRFLHRINFEFKTWYFKFQGLPGPGGKNGFPVLYKTRDIKDENLTALLNPFLPSFCYLQSFSSPTTMKTIWFNLPLQSPNFVLNSSTFYRRGMSLVPFKVSQNKTAIICFMFLKTTNYCSKKNKQYFTVQHY